MLDRALVLRRLGLLCLVATFGCKPDPVSPTTDPEPTPDPGGPTAVRPEPDEADPDPDPSENETAVVAPEPGPDEADPDPDPAETEPAAVVAAPKETKEREPLPKPIHKLSGATCQKSFAVGNKVKNFRLPSVDGKKTVSPGNYRNKVVLLNFWGTWCKPCLKELPEFDRLYRKYRKHGLRLVAVATDEEPEGVQEFIDKHKLRAKVALAGEEAAGAYSRPNFPFSFVVDGSGKIVAAYEFIDDNCMGDLEQVIRDELDKLD